MENSDYKPGDWKAVCDLCGFFFMASELQENYRGQRVCKKDFETRHPQELVRTRPERWVPDWTRPDTDTQTPDVSTVTAGPVNLSASLQNTLFRYSTTGAAGTISVVLPDANNATFRGVSVVYVVNLESGTYGFTFSTTTAGRLVGNASQIVGTSAQFRSDPTNNLWYRM